MDWANPLEIGDGSIQLATVYPYVDWLLDGVLIPGKPTFLRCPSMKSTPASRPAQPHPVKAGQIPPALPLFCVNWHDFKSTFL